MDYSQYNLEKTGYLNEEFRLFHIKDQTSREFSWHYHDFHKIIVFRFRQLYQEMYFQ